MIKTPTITMKSVAATSLAPKEADAMRLETQFASTMATDEHDAVQEIAKALLVGNATYPGAILFYCSAAYDLERLAKELTETFKEIPLVGCTSSGQIDDEGFRKGGISAVAMSAADLVVTPHVIANLSTDCEGQAKVATSKIMADREKQPAEMRTFGLLLVDGLSLMEERLTAALYCSLGDVPIVGGSAGDDLAFKRTHVFANGKFVSDAAILATFTTSLPFTTFKLQHFAPTDRMIVITAADPKTRTVFEIDGEPAAEVYARLLGVSTSSLDAQLCSANPLVLEIDGEPYVRSIGRVNPDKSMTLLCAIDEGMVLSIGAEVDAMKTLDQAFNAVREQLPMTGRGASPFVIGCDCILRRLEFEQRGTASRIGELMAANRVFGFSTYGEQFNGVHVNQTFTGVAIGGQS